MAYDISKQDVLDYAPSLSTVSDAAWVGILAYVNEFTLTIACWVPSEATVTLARIYLAAHIGLMTKLATSGAAGPVTAESVGGVRRSYGLIAGAISNSSLMSTRDGQLYLDILNSTVGGPILL